MKIIAHRCGTDKFPELTIDSAKYSLSHGARLVEMDVHFTSDGVPVVSHDVDCTLFGDKRQIKDMTADEFLCLCYKDGSGYRAQTLENFMQSGIKDILFHIKVGGEKLVDVLTLCRKYDIENSVVFGVGNLADVKTVKEFNSNIKVLAFLYDLERMQEYADLGADFIRLWEGWMTEENIANVHKTGKELWIMACENGNLGYTNPENLPAWQEKGVDAILVNDVCGYLI